MSVTVDAATASPIIKRQRVESSQTNHPSVLCIEQSQSNINMEAIFTIVSANQVLLQSLTTDVSKLKSEVEIIKNNFIDSAAPVGDQINIQTIVDKVTNISDKLETTNPASVRGNIKASLVIPDYEKKLLDRKRAFYNHMHNSDRFRLHRLWLDQEDPFTPPKYLPKPLKHGESERLYLIRKKDGLNSLASDMEIWQARRDEAEAVYLSIDSDVEKFITDLETEQVSKNQLIAEYTGTVSADEESSRKRWQKGLKHLEDMPNWSKKHISSVDNRTYRQVVSDSNSNSLNTSFQEHEGWSTVQHNKRRNKPKQPPVATPYFCYDYSRPPPPLPYTYAGINYNSNYPNLPNSLTRETQSFFHNSRKTQRWKNRR